MIDDEQKSRLLAAVVVQARRCRTVGSFAAEREFG
jgi:hypothetical protein